MFVVPKKDNAGIFRFSLGISRPFFQRSLSFAFTRVISSLISTRYTGRRGTLPVELR